MLHCAQSRQDKAAPEAHLEAPLCFVLDLLYLLPVQLLLVLLQGCLGRLPLCLVLLSLAPQLCRPASVVGLLLCFPLTPLLHLHNTSHTIRKASCMLSTIACLATFPLAPFSVCRKTPKAIVQSLE